MYIVLGFRKNGQSFMKHQGNVQLKLRFVVLIAFVLYMYIFLVKCLYMIFLRRTTAKAFAKNVFINQERKLEDRRRSDTVLVLTINDAN